MIDFVTSHLIDTPTAEPLEQLSLHSYHHPQYQSSTVVSPFSLINWSKSNRRETLGILLGSEVYFSCLPND
jgi:hypothetical protein